ncbi:MAG TPA: HAMP domain-containing sensor histidine kinase [Ktedonobacterales bacterium]
MEQEELEEMLVAPPEGVLAVDAANRARSHFISMVSHELRTPLNAINGFLSIVLDEQVGKLNDRQREFLEYAHDSTEQLIRLVQDILLISKADSGQLELQCADLALFDVLALVLRSSGLAANKAGVTLQSQVSPRLPRLWADAARLQQVFMNLVHNALKFTPPGGSVTIRARRAGELAEVSVTDTGCGIPYDDQPRIFDRFYQAEDALLVKHGGSGLGLTVARAIVEQHGGRIWLQSEPDCGSTFSFTIPLIQSQKRPAHQPGGLVQ